MRRKILKNSADHFYIPIYFKIKGIRAAAQFQQVTWNKIPKHYKCLTCYYILIGPTLEKTHKQQTVNRCLRA